VGALIFGLRVPTLRIAFEGSCTSPTCLATAFIGEMVLPNSSGFWQTFSV
jgi:hypothetical protein